MTDNIYVKAKVVPLHPEKAHGGGQRGGGDGCGGVSGDVAVRIVNLGIRWRRVVSLMPKLFNPQRKSLLYPLNWQLVELVSDLDILEENKICTMLGFE